MNKEKIKSKKRLGKAHIKKVYTNVMKTLYCKTIITTIKHFA